MLSHELEASQSRTRSYCDGREQCLDGSRHNEVPVKEAENEVRARLSLSLVLGCATVPMDGKLSFPTLTVKQSGAAEASIAIRNGTDQDVRVVSFCGAEEDGRPVMSSGDNDPLPCFLVQENGRRRGNPTVTPENPYCYIEEFGRKAEHRRYDNAVAAHSVKYLTLLPTPMTTWTTSASVRCEHHLQK